MGWPDILHALCLLLLLTDLYLHFEHVVLEVAFLLRAVREDHLSVPVLDSTDPLTLIAAAIGPVHLAVAVSFVLFVFALVDVSTGPLEYTIAVLAITQVVTFITVALGSTSAAPFSFTFFHSGYKITHVTCTI